MRTIKSKVVVLVVAAVTSAVLISSLASAWREANRRYEAKTNEWAAIAATLATSVAPALVRADRTDVARALNAAGRIKRLTYARVTDLEGRTVYEIGSGIVVGRVQGAADANEAIGPFSAAYLATYPVATQIVAGGVIVGRLVLIADVSELRDALFESVLSSLLAGLAAGIVGYIISQRLQHSVTEPIARLTAAMRSVSRTRDYTGVVPRFSNDEVGVLVETFNDMMSEIRFRDEALARNRDTLESEVMERTRDLAIARSVAENANAAKSEFLATMSHEIRTPMNGMMVMAELMAAGELPPRLHRYARVLVSSGQSLLSIINDILDFSKIEAGKMDIESVPVRPSTIVDDAVRLFHERAKAEGVELVAHVAPSVPQRIATDSVRLNQILTNLINNALKFTERGSVLVELSCQYAGDVQAQLVLSVTDTGIGIPDDKLATIFEAFSQADQSTTRRFGGTGIGLTICHRLAKAMGGDISVSSQPDIGSTFTLTLPVAVLETTLPPRIERSASPQTRVVVTLEDTALRTTLLRYLIDHAFAPVCMSLAELHECGGFDASAIIGFAADMHNLVLSNTLGFGPGRVVVLCALAELGDTFAQNLASEGAIDALLPVPFANEEIVALLKRIATGRAAFCDGHGEIVAPLPVPNISRLLDGVHVLAADDSPVNREVLIEALRRLNVKVTCVENGRAAVDAIMAMDFDLVLMDVSMPIMDGIEATRAVRAWEAHLGRPALPIVALTGHVIGDQSALWRTSGMSDCITKPFTLQALHTCLLRWLQPRPEEYQVEAHDVSTMQLALTPAKERADEIAQRLIEINAGRLLDDDALASIRAIQRPGDTLVARVIELYRQHAPVAANLLRGVSETDSPSRIAEAAHALKSQSRNVGALRVGDLCDCVETMALAGMITMKDTFDAAIAAALQQTLTELEARSRSEGTDTLSAAGVSARS